MTDSQKTQGRCQGIMEEVNSRIANAEVNGALLEKRTSRFHGFQMLFRWFYYRVSSQGAAPRQVIAQGEVKRSPESHDSNEINPERVTQLRFMNYATPH